MNKQKRALSKINASMRAVEADEDMTGLRKRVEIQRLTKIRNEIAEKAVKAARGRS